MSAAPLGLRRPVTALISHKHDRIMPGRGVRRRWTLDLHGIRREGTKETGFTYRHADGRVVSDEKTLSRVAKLRIPPAWQNVRIARSGAAPLQAVGTDRKGRTQYRYHDRFRRDRDEEKFRRIVEFGEALPGLRRRVRSDLARDPLDRERVVAAIVRLIDQGFFRVGNDKSARHESTYGLTTILGSTFGSRATSFSSTTSASGRSNSGASCATPTSRRSSAG